MAKFKLIGRTNVFTVTKFYNAAGFIPSIIGHTVINGETYRTAARIVDVIQIKESNNV